MFFWAAMVIATATVVLVSITLFPHIKPKSHSLVYCGDIAKKARAEQYLREVGRADHATEIANQVWEVSRIASLKYRFVRWAYLSAIVFLGLYVLARLCYW